MSDVYIGAFQQTEAMRIGCVPLTLFARLGNFMKP